MFYRFELSNKLNIDISMGFFFHSLPTKTEDGELLGPGSIPFEILASKYVQILYYNYIEININVFR